MRKDQEKEQIDTYRGYVRGRMGHSICLRIHSDDDAKITRADNKAMKKKRTADKRKYPYSTSSEKRFAPYSVASTRCTFAGSRGSLFRVNRGASIVARATFPAQPESFCTLCANFLTSPEIRAPATQSVPFPASSSSFNSEKSDTIKDEYRYVFDRFTRDYFEL
ncbi:hypothetical protein DPMN_054082 [Dreissena polymorpha]|uniref:Uncharacterized protein n=1 Tax=Dreissena polymorpha TaxID=45954 RepID=A0A9D4CPV9_DREPO|nr:hypothetical protein DPMN_054082 [Dreissena polymorpha]